MIYVLDLTLHKIGRFFVQLKRSRATSPSLASSQSRPTPQEEWRRIANGTLTINSLGHMIALTGVIAAITVDWVCQLVTRYTTGPVHLDDGFVLILPYSTVLRPLVLLLRSDTLRASGHSFVNTLYQSGPVLLLFGLVLVFFGAISVVISADRQKQYRDGMFTNVFSASSTLFTYMTTAENWPDVVWPATHCERETGHVSGGCWRFLYHTFFMTVSIVGTIILMSLVIANFEELYRKQYQDRAERRRARQLQGIVASFVALETAASRRYSALLNANEVLDYFAFCGLDHVDLGKLGRGFGMTLNVADYAELCEEVRLIVTDFVPFTLYIVCCDS